MKESLTASDKPIKVKVGQPIQFAEQIFILSSYHWDAVNQLLHFELRKPEARNRLTREREVLG